MHVSTTLSSSEAKVNILKLKTHRFIRDYGIFCVAGYILGIGDRHLENFLINTQTGEVIGIDFGISFGDGLNLTVPELIPFRLTKNFLTLMDPIGVKGDQRHSMI